MLLKRYNQPRCPVGCDLAFCFKNSGCRRSVPLRTIRRPPFSGKTAPSDDLPEILTTGN